MASADDPALRQMAAAMRKKTTQKLGNLWWAFMFRGLIAIALAVCALVWPQKTVSILVILLGAYFLVDSVPGAYAAWRGTGRWSELLSVLVSVVIGLVLLLWPAVSARAFLILVGAWAVVQGVSLFLTSRRLEPYEPARGPLGTIGVVLALVGIVFVIWPETGVVAVSWLIAGAAAVIGGLLLFLASRLNRLRGRVESRGARDGAIDV